MSFEVEVKYRAVDHDHWSNVLFRWGPWQGRLVDQEDTYFSHPARDFAVTNEAFRIRRLGDENRITYKGPRRSGPTKTREEIEIPFQAGRSRSKAAPTVREPGIPAGRDDPKAARDVPDDFSRHRARNRPRHGRRPG